VQYELDECIYKLYENLYGKEHLGDILVAGRIILKLNLKE
jgi:hypothetical protein